MLNRIFFFDPMHQPLDDNTNRILTRAVKTVCKDYFRTLPPAPVIDEYATDLTRLSRPGYMLPNDDRFDQADQHDRDSFYDLRIIQVPFDNFAKEDHHKHTGDAICAIAEQWLDIAYPDYWAHDLYVGEWNGDVLRLSDLQAALRFITTSNQRGTRCFHLDELVSDYSALRSSIIEVRYFLLEIRQQQTFSTTRVWTTTPI